MPTNEEFRHQAAGGRPLGSESECVGFDGRGKTVGGLKSRARVGDEVGYEGHILFALCDGLRARYRTTGLNPRKSAEPRELNVVVLEGGDRGGVGLHGDIFRGDLELVRQIRRDLVETFLEPCGVLIRNRGKMERLSQGCGRQGESQKDGHSYWFHLRSSS